MLGPFTTANRRTLPFTRCRYCRTPSLSHAACASMSTTTMTTTTTTTTLTEGTAMAPQNGLKELEMRGKAWYIATRPPSEY